MSARGPNGTFHGSDMPLLPPQTSKNSGGTNHGRPSTDAFSKQEFTFQNPPSGPASIRRHDNQPVDRHRRLRRHDDHENLNPARRRPYRGERGRPRLATSNRPLLRNQNGDDQTESEVLGVPEGTARYLNPEDIDDSEEEEMDESASDIEDDKPPRNGLDASMDDASVEPPAKRQDVGMKGSDDADRPKWSNPDPYSVLPPIDHMAGKRKDPVETIRKLRKVRDEASERRSQVVANDDFISFDVDPALSQSPRSDDQDSASESDGGVRLSNDLKTSHQLKRQENRPRETRNGRDLNSNDVDSSGQGLSNILVIPHGDIILDIPDEDLVTNSSDGRKRTRDSHIKGRYGRPKIPKATGLLPTFFPIKGMNPVPWVKSSGYVTTNAGFRLHQEIADFFDFVRPQRFEEKIREELLDRLQIMVKRFDTTASVHCFGSFAAGLYLPNADMDVVVLSTNFIQSGKKVLCNSNSKLFRFGDFIKRSRMAAGDEVEVIAGAKVPIIKFVDSLSKIRVDMSFENDSGLHAVNTFHHWREQFPAMPSLVTLIKQFLLMRKLNEVQHGGIGGFTVTCLIVSLLQNMPRTQQETFSPEEHLGEILIEFLDLYGRRFDVSRTGIQMEPHGYFDKQSYNNTRSIIGLKGSQIDRIAIVDPKNSDNDVSGGSSDVKFIFSLFAKAHGHILKAMQSKSRPSLLDWMVGGNYQDVLSQRNHLRKLYDMRQQGHPNLQTRSLTADPLATRDAQTLDHTDGAPTLRKPLLISNIAPTMDWTQLAPTLHTTQSLASKPDIVPTTAANSKKPSKSGNTAPPTKPAQSAKVAKKPSDNHNSANADRAQSLQLRFPNETSIPAEITKEDMKRLVSQFEAKVGKQMNFKRPSRDDLADDTKASQMIPRSSYKPSQRHFLSTVQPPHLQSNHTKRSPADGPPGDASSHLQNSDQLYNGFVWGKAEFHTTSDSPLPGSSQDCPISLE